MRPNTTWVRFVDANGDGKVTLAEFKTSRVAMMMRADASKDGKLSKEEFMDKQKDPAHAAENYIKFDKDKDTFLTKEEFVKMGK